MVFKLACFFFVNLIIKSILCDKCVIPLDHDIYFDSPS